MPRCLPAAPSANALCSSRAASPREARLQGGARVATAFPARGRVFREVTPAQQRKRPTPCTLRYDRPPGRSRSSRSSRHRRRHAPVANARVFGVARSLREARRSTHRGPPEVNPSLLRARIAKAPAPALGRQSMSRDHQSFVGPRRELRRDGRCSTHFAKCHLCGFGSHSHGTIEGAAAPGKPSSLRRIAFRKTKGPPHATVHLPGGVPSAVRFRA